MGYVTTQFLLDIITRPHHSVSASRHLKRRGMKTLNEQMHQRAARLKLLICGLFLCSSLLSLRASSLVTQATNTVAAFQAGGEVLGFDELPGISGAGSGNTGSPIPAASQLTTNYNQLGIQFSSTNRPVGVVSVKGLGNQ